VALELAIPKENPSEPRMHRSRFGGLWVDRRDAHAILADRRSRGLLSQSEAIDLVQYIDHGYVVFPGAVSVEVVDEYLALFERMWEEAPETILAYSEGRLRPMSRDLYGKVAKVSNVHCYFDRAGEIIFPPPVLRFLDLIYDRPPVVFQTMTMRWGTEEPMHMDTGPLSLTEPMSLVGSWLALEDVADSSGEFEFIPGSHRLPESLHHGVSKAHYGDMTEYGRVLDSVSQQCGERGLKVDRFTARKGDVLVWHGDLMHGGGLIGDDKRTRKSLVSHFMPLGVMPTFQDFSSVSEFAYPTGGNCLDSLTTVGRYQYVLTKSEGSRPVAQGAWRWRDRLPRPVVVVARRCVDRLSALFK
jgi:phytanoyl-CoA hydroxylase